MLLLAVVAGLLLSADTGLSAGERSLARAVYEFAVTGYCGLQDAEVEAGFRAERASLTARGGFEEEEARRLRIQGWVDAEREWRNRGLGGHRAWCRSEGLAARRHFQAIARGERHP